MLGGCVMIRKARARVSLDVINQRKSLCAGCEFMGRLCQGQKVCSLWKCSWRNQLVSAKGRCALGLARFPAYMHLSPRW